MITCQPELITHRVQRSADGSAYVSWVHYVLTNGLDYCDVLSVGSEQVRDEQDAAATLRSEHQRNLEKHCEAHNL